jgi:hypothetical protein
VREEEIKLSPTQVRALLSAASGDRLEALYLLANIPTCGRVCC